MHFSVRVLDGGKRVQVTSYPMDGDERAYFQQSYPIDSGVKLFGMNMSELSLLCGFNTDGDGNVSGRVMRDDGKPSYSGELPAFVRKPSHD